MMADTLGTEFLRPVSITLSILVAVALFIVGWILGRLGIGSIAEPPSLSDAERRFVERMRCVVLVGSFTDATRPAEPAQPERYDIASVEKVGDDLWRFNATLQCCGVNGDLPVVVPLRFTGDTPMIMMTDTSLPGLGTFSVRLLFYGDRYAGTWQHGERSGHMAGRIEARDTPFDAIEERATRPPG